MLLLLYLFAPLHLCLHIFLSLLLLLSLFTPLSVCLFSLCVTLCIYLFLQIPSQFISHGGAGHQNDPLHYIQPTLHPSHRSFVQYPPGGGCVAQHLQSRINGTKFGVQPTASDPFQSSLCKSKCHLNFLLAWWAPCVDAAQLNSIPVINYDHLLILHCQFVIKQRLLLLLSFSLLLFLLFLLISLSSFASSSLTFFFFIIDFPPFPLRLPTFPLFPSLPSVFVTRYSYDSFMGSLSLWHPLGMHRQQHFLICFSLCVVVHVSVNICVGVCVCITVT